jgi:serine/threonine protein kinase
MAFEDFESIETLWENEHTRFGYAKGYPGKGDAFIQVIYPPQAADLPEVRGFDFEENFRQLAGRLIKLKGKGMPRILDYGVEEGCAFIIYEIFSGWTLEEFFSEEGTLLPPDVAQSLASQLIHVADTMHSQRPTLYLGHIRPDMILVSDEYELRLLSYGYLRFYPPELRRVLLAEDPSFSAHELIETGEDSAGADVFSVACHLYLILTGRTPSKAAGAFVTPGSLNPAVTGAQSAAVMKGMESLPSNRFASIRQLRDALLGRVAPVRDEIQPELFVDVERIEAPLTLEGSIYETSFVVKNVGKGQLTGTIEVDKEWVKLNPTSFSEDEEPIHVWLDASKLNAGTYKAEIKIYSKAGDRSIFVNFPVQMRKRYPTLMKILRFVSFLIPLLALLAYLIYAALHTPTTKLVK